MFSIKPNTNETSNQVYKHILGFEKSLGNFENIRSWQGWMQLNWMLSIKISLAYIILVFLGKHYMQSRQKYELRTALVIWNIMLAIFSLAGTIRVWPDFLHVMQNEGIIHSICRNDYAYGTTGAWALLFVLSKLPELVDTFFIVLRKQELIFLHWYHHATVLIYCWYSYIDLASTGRWFMTMNYLVHSLMYTYYAFKAMRFKVPKFISQMITTGQILQMIVGCAINYLAFRVKSSNQACDISEENIKYSLLMYMSYFVLFFNFFLNAYILNKQKMARQNMVKKIN